MSESCNSCAAAGSCNTESCSSAPQLTKAQKASNVKKVIAVMSGKGGVGKSSVTGMLAVSLMRQGFKVGILDSDITGPSIPKIFGIKERAGASQGGIIAPTSRGGIKIMSLNLMIENEDDPVILRGPLITQVVNQFWKDVIWGELDYLLIDMPPGTGDVAITIFQSLPINGVVMVTSPQALANMVVRKAIKMVRNYEPPIYGLIENMAYVQCPDCSKKIEVFGKPQGEEEAKRTSIPFLGALPLDPNLATLSDAGKIEDYRSSDFDQIARNLADQIKLSSDKNLA
ncbi:Mrp/NBP35 family ATP-binding protein [Desulfosporosinus sp.]|uniref:Mrp/NBP35 family ATP-binding protein n=1 Tax=Desulfosporosinus sp. TaxID=157907 RepID=UPI000E8A84CE|nr:Mrp/NBP35 family ATP-binding protein [Desulfosporosinus sp.]MBC2723205.1 Mrp/NBP35 family ATP-binding protein [Desulfosporosinus sp.]MBC2729017.1 Mrp/NBP35 family ATP-binding protein [Desulfosporosinus sp.]HBV86460.1 ATP-binding protein [Desulfosporosinus sp.]